MIIACCVFGSDVESLPFYLWIFNETGKNEYFSIANARTPAYNKSI